MKTTLECAEAILSAIKGTCTPAQSAVLVEYTNCISAEGVRTLKLCSASETKPSDGDASVVEL